MHDSLTIALLQAREAAMAHFRPIVKRHNLTEQQWRIVRILAEHPSMDFHDLAFRACILRSEPDRHPDPYGTRRPGAAFKTGK
ncbi:Homoprotocatechuate degradative operon repressor [Klebsiella oxytoca]|nr:Homoprotocatechuate degradative operon repressor [Klebsiella oxytoca]